MSIKVLKIPITTTPSLGMDSWVRRIPKHVRKAPGIGGMAIAITLVIRIAFRIYPESTGTSMERLRKVLLSFREQACSSP